MKKSIFYLLIAIFAILAVTIPFMIDWLIIGNNIPSNISNADWVAFLGGYIGAIIGAVISFVGIIITIRYTNEQNKQDRKLQIRPYCSIRYVHDNKLVGTNKIICQIPIGCEPEDNNGPKYTSILYIKNIGLGPAVEFEFKVDEIDDGREHYPIIMEQNSDISNHYVDLLQVGEEAALPIYIWFNFDAIREEDIIDTGQMGINRYIIKHEVMTKYKNFDIVIHIKYYDMYQNQYNQKIVLSSSMYISSSIGEKQHSHMCDIYLKEVGIPKNIQAIRVRAT